MKIKWYGHASFLLTGDDGFRIVTDPYTPETVGYSEYRDEADLAIASSGDDTSHCRVDLIPGNPVTVNALEVARAGGETEAAGVRIRAVEVCEALEGHPHHDPPLPNAMYRFTLDGISFGHMGDVGNPLDADQTAFFEGIDVLLALTGGHPTIALDDLMDLIRTVNPKLVVPMHFRTLRWKEKLGLWISSFLEYWDEQADVDFAADHEAKITRDELTESTRVLVLDYV